MKAVWMFFGAAVLANAADPVQLSLKRAVEIATSAEGSARIQLAGEAAQIAERRQDQARAALLPNLDATVGVQNATRNLASFGLQIQSPIPGFQIPSFVGPFTVVDARVTGTQTVFDFAALRRYQAAKSNVAASKQDIDFAEEQVASQVARIYLAAVKADADVEAAEANVTLSEAVLKQADNQKAAGTGTGIEITRAKVQLANDRQRLSVAANARRTSRFQLLRAMGLRLDAEVELTDRLQFVPADQVTLEQARKKAIEERPDYKAQQDREENARLSSSAIRLERLPSVSAFGDYGPIGTSPFDARPTRTAGVSVKLPLFNGARDARRGESAAMYRSEKVRTNDLKAQIELDVRVALDALRAAEEQVTVSKEGLALAENEMAQARRRYDAGVSTGLEVTDAQTRLERARDNQIAALYGYNVAKLDLAQAMGTVREWVQ